MGFYKKDIDSGNFRIHKPRNYNTWIAPGSPWHSNITGYCNSWTWPVSWSGETNEKAKSLPRGVFLVWGDGAWPAVPARAQGGPCYFGKLILFAPSIHQMLNISNKLKRVRCTVYQLGPEWKDDAELWERPSVILASLFTPQVASAKALTQLRQLACLTEKTNSHYLQSIRWAHHWCQQYTTCYNTKSSCYWFSVISKRTRLWGFWGNVLYESCWIILSPFTKSFSNCRIIWRNSAVVENPYHEWLSLRDEEPPAGQKTLIDGWVSIFLLLSLLCLLSFVVFSPVWRKVWNQLLIEPALSKKKKGDV